MEDLNDWKIKKIHSILSSVKNGLLLNNNIISNELVAFCHKNITEQLNILNYNNFNNIIKNDNLLLMTSLEDKMIKQNINVLNK